MSRGVEMRPQAIHADALRNARSTAFIRVCQPAPWARYHANTSASTRSAICCLRTGSGKPRWATASAQSSGVVAGASAVNLTFSSGKARRRAQSGLSVFAVAPEPRCLFMGNCLSGRNQVGDVALFTTWRPHHEQGHAIEHTDALQAQFTIGMAHIFAREQIAVKKTIKIGKINPVIGQILCPLALIPCVHRTRL